MPAIFAYPRFVSSCAAVALALVGAAGCSSETGLIIEVSAENLDVQPDSLFFFVGVQDDLLTHNIGGCGTSLRFTEDAPFTERRISVVGRDLATDPYKLLLSPEGALSLENDVMVSVIASVEGQGPVAIGTLANPIAFSQGNVLSWPIVLGTDNPNNIFHAGDGCLCNNTGEGMVAIVSPQDPDCDGDIGDDDCNHDDPSIGRSQNEVCDNNVDENCNGLFSEEVDEDGDLHFTCVDDCNDNHPDVYVGAPELCDGLDNDCNPNNERFPEKSDCYFTDAFGACFQGKRYCDDSGFMAQGWLGECWSENTEITHEASPSLCDEFGICLDQGELYDDAAMCADRIYRDIDCRLKVEVDPNGSGYRSCGGGVALGQDLNEMDYCQWILMGGIEQEGYRARLHGMNGDPGSTTGDYVEECHARFGVFGVLDLPPELPRDAEFRIWSMVEDEPGELLHLYLQAEVLEDGEPCPDGGGLTCTELQSLPPLEMP